MKKIFLGFALLTFSYSGFAQLSVKQELIDTYFFNDPNPLPSTANKSKFYPYNTFNGYSFLKEKKDFTVITLENEHIKVEVLPEVGGKVWGAVDKNNGNEFIYKNEVLKFRNIAMRGPWTSGGIEFNFGIIGHHPSTSSPVDYRVEELEDGSMICTVGSIDLPSRTQWRVKIVLPKNQSAFKTEALWYNPTPTDKAYYNWMTAAAVAKDDLTFYAPGNMYLEHNGNPHPWPFDKTNRNLSNYSENNFGSSKSYHVVGEYNDFFGGYYSDSDIGFGHYSRYDEMPGKKLWIWDLSRFGGIWEDLLTDEDGQYIEYQAGRLFDQYFPGVENTLSQAVFDPSRTDQWEEFWFPVKNLDGIQEASSKGALNFTFSEDQLSIKVNSFIETNGTIVVIQNGEKQEISIPFKLNGYEEVNFEQFKASDPFHIMIPELDLVYTSTPNLLERPWMTDTSVMGISTADKIFQKGLNARRYREYDAAKSLFETVLANDPAHLDALEELAKLFYEQSLFNEAERIIKIGLSIDTYHGGLNYIAGLNYQAQKDHINALESYGWAAHSTEFRSVSYEHMSQIHLVKKNFNEALHYANLAIQNNSLNINALSQKYLSLSGLNRKKEANMVLKEIEKIDPLSHFVAFEKYTQKRIDLTEHTSYHRSEYPFQTFLELALFYKENGFENKANEVLELSPSHFLIELHKAYINGSYTSLDDIEKTPIDFIFPFRKETLEALIWANSFVDHWKLKYFEGLNLIALNQLEKGISVLEKLSLDPDDPLFYWIRGHFTSERDFLSSKGDFYKAYQGDKNNWRYILSYANSLNANGEVKEAISILSKGYKKHNQNYTLGLKLAELYVDVGSFEESISLLKKLHVLPYEHAKDSRQIYLKAYLGQSVMLMSEGKNEAAKEYLKAAIEWPEELGVGKPFNPDERIAKFFLAFISEDSKESQKELHTILDYSITHLNAAKKENLLGLYAFNLLEGRDKAIAFIENLEKVATNAKEREIISEMLIFFNSNPLNSIKELNPKKIYDFIFQ